MPEPIFMVLWALGVPIVGALVCANYTYGCASLAEHIRNERARARGWRRWVP